MAETQDEHDKSEDPTQKRLDDALQRGDVAKSQEVNTWFVIAGAALILMAFAGSASRDLSTTMRGLIANSSAIRVDGRGFLAVVQKIALEVLAAITVPLLLLVLAAIIANLIQHRLVWSGEPLKPKLSKISPLAGLKRMFSKQALANFIKGLLKLALLGAVMVALLWPERSRLDNLVKLDPAAILPMTQTLSLQMLGAVVVILAFIAAADYLFQYRQWFERQKMSIRELKDEFKQTEGDPHVKGKIRQLREARARKRMMAAVPEASVVITNPTHYAVALKYDRGMNAPICVAKGVDGIALKIREVAGKHQVPIVESPPLARALHGTVEIDQEIPPEHYKAVAEVIGYVMRLNRAVAGARESVRLPAIMAQSQAMGERSAVDRTRTGQHGGSIGLVLLIAVALVGAGVGLMLIGRTKAEPYILGLLAVLAMIGVFLLFALAAGMLRASGRDAASPLVKNLVDGAADAIVVTDSANRVIYANVAYLDLVSATDADDVRPVERVFLGDPGVSEAVYRLLKAAREGRRLQEEVRVGGQKGEAGRWLRMRVRPLGEGKRESRLTVWAIADVTRELERQENVFQELQHAIDYLDHAPAGFFSADAEGGISYLNATLAEWLDHDLAEIANGGLKLADIVAGEGAALLTTLSAAPGEVKIETLDIDLKTRSGRTVPARLFHKVAFGADGTPGPSRTLVINRAGDDGNDPLRAAEVRFMRFFQHTPMAIATVDRQGMIARSNALFARLFNPVLPPAHSPPPTGESKGGGSGRSILAGFAEGDRPALEAAIRSAAAKQGEIAPVDAAIAGNGERFARCYVTAVEEDGDQEAAIVYILETTEQRALQNQVIQQQKIETIGKLAGNIAHDFNNLLGAIMMASDFLVNAHKPTDPSFQDIIQIRQNVNRAAALVRHLLAFSRKQTMRLEVHDLGEALNDLSTLLQRLIGEKVKLDAKLGRDLWPVRVDLGQFEQVIINLAVNARDAMPDGGRPTLRTANVRADESAEFQYKGMPLGEYVVVEVTDTGTGIPPEIKDKIWDPFFTTKEIGKGTGLGLSTAYGIIKQTGGFIYVDSEVGKGTTFRIFLPRYIPAADDVRAPQLPETTAPALAGAMSAAEEARRAAADLTGHGTILLVEDEEGLRALNARGLESRGFTVLQAGNGVEALEEIERQGGQVDLVVSDVVMPEMDGPALLKELRSRNPGIKFIFVSGYAEDAFQKSLPNPDAYNFLAKPFTLKQLVAKVKETMAV